MHTTLSITLPIDSQAFGGIVGSRVTAAAVQIAYLEKGNIARVRYIEESLPTWEGSGAMQKILARTQGKDLVLEVEIVSELEKQSTSQKE